MAKQAKMKNLAGRGVNVFTNGLPVQAEEDQQPAKERPKVVTQAQPVPAVPEAQKPPAPKLNPSSKKEKPTVLRSYHLPRDLVDRLDDAYMVYQLRKEEKDKQEIVAEALQKHFEALEQEGFFEVLALLRP